MNSIDLGSLGTARGAIPSSLAVSWDFVLEWTGGLTKAQSFHLHAAAIGAFNQTNLLPRYPKEKGDPIGYGFKVFEMLLRAGLTPADVIEKGSPILTKLIEQAAGTSSGEVKEKEDFS